MEDSQIIELFWKRSEQAIEETRNKYGDFCYVIAKNILSSHEDAEECVNDTYRRAWDNIPPQCPVLLRPWLGKVVRNLAINLWNKKHAQKRNAEMAVLLSELEDCIPAAKSAQDVLEERELSECISDWLMTLEREDRILFVRRCWNGISLKQLAGEQGCQPEKLAQRMFRLRNKLRAALEKEGVTL